VTLSFEADAAEARFSLLCSTDDREAATRFTRSGGLDRGVEREQAVSSALREASSAIWAARVTPPDTSISAAVICS